MARVPGNRVIRLGVSLGEPQRRTIPNEYVEAEGIYAVSYTHLTLPTNREV